MPPADRTTEIYHLPVSLPTLLLLPISIIIPALYLPLDRPYVLSNVLALCLATTTLAILKLDSFFTAFLLLGVLLVYDIFWVRPVLTFPPDLMQYA
jgi:minor histocompatibility antigen H13